MEPEFKEYIAIGEKKAGKQTELSKILGISEAYIRTAKTGKRGLPVPICIRLARFIEANELLVIAASDLVTEKDEEKRKILKSCFSRAAGIIIVTSIISIMTLAPASPIHAAQISNTVSNTNYWQLVY